MARISHFSRASTATVVAVLLFLSVTSAAAQPSARGKNGKGGKAAPYATVAYVDKRVEEGDARLLKYVEESDARTVKLIEESDARTVKLVEESDARTVKLVEESDARIAKLIEESDARTVKLVEENNARLLNLLEPALGAATAVLSADGQSCEAKVDFSSRPGFQAVCAVDAESRIPVLIMRVSCPLGFILAAEATCEGGVFSADLAELKSYLPLMGSGTVFGNSSCVVPSNPPELQAGEVVRAGQVVTCIYNTVAADAPPALRTMAAAAAAAAEAAQSSVSGMTQLLP